MMVIQLMSNLIESKEWAAAEKSLSGSCHKPKLECAAPRSHCSYVFVSTVDSSWQIQGVSSKAESGINKLRP
jgi:hypothetical protein